MYLLLTQGPGPRQVLNVVGRVLILLIVITVPLRGAVAGGEAVFGEVVGGQVGVVYAVANQRRVHVLLANERRVHVLLANERRSRAFLANERRAHRLIHRAVQMWTATGTCQGN